LILKLNYFRNKNFIIQVFYLNFFSQKNFVEFLFKESVSSKIDEKIGRVDKTGPEIAKRAEVQVIHGVLVEEQNHV
jgi:hypothetical protein